MHELQTVLIVVDACTQLDNLLEAALQLAGRQRAALRGLFVEDAGLLSVAALPFAREVSTVSATSRPLSAQAIERQLQNLAAQMRARLASAADQAQLAWSFQVCRGSMPQTIRETDADVILCSWRSPVFGTRSRVKSPRVAPLVVLFDGSESSVRALAFSQQLLAADSQASAVVVCSRESVAVLQDLVWQVTDERGTERVTVRELPSDQHLLAAVRSLNPRLVLVGRDDHRCGEPEFQLLFSGLECPLGIVR